MRKMPQLKRIIQKIKVDKDGNVDIYLRLFSDLSLDETVLIHHYETIRPVRQRRRPQCFRPPPLNPIEPQQTAPNAVPPPLWVGVLPKPYRHSAERIPRQPQRQCKNVAYAIHNRSGQTNERTRTAPRSSLSPELPLTHTLEAAHVRHTVRWNSTPPDIRM